MTNDMLQLGREKRFLVLLGVICLALIGGALYMQIVLGEAPCPLCILQRYALLLIAIFAFIGAAMPGRRLPDWRAEEGQVGHLQPGQGLVG